MGLTKQQLEALNNSSFPNNNTGYITPTILRSFNSESIANTVNQDVYTTDSASVDSRLDSLEAFSASLDATFATDAQLNASSSTLQANINTKLDTASFDTFSSSVDSRLDSLESFSSSLDTNFASQTEFNSFTASYEVDSASFSSRIDNVTFDTSSLTSTASFNAFTQSYYVDSASFDSRILAITSSGGINTGSFATTGSNTFTGQQTLSNTASLQFPLEIISGGISTEKVGAGGWIIFNVETNGGLIRRNVADLGLLAQTGSLELRSTSQSVLLSGSQILLNGVDFIPFSTSVDSRINGVSINTSSFATTGSNTFKGIETLQDDGGNTTAITPYSGSLLFVANTFASTSLNYITASTNKVNIILKDNNISGAFLLTGSGNIITNPNTASVGFINYIGNNNYSNNSATQFSSSMTSLPSFNSNILNAGLVYFRGGSAVTGTQIFLSNIVNNANLLFGNLAGTLTFDKAVAGYNVQSNIVNNSPIIAANVNNLASAFVFQRNYINSTPTIAMSSSAFTMNGNYLGSTGTYTNQYFSSSIGSGSATIARNIINGATNAITITGSQPAGAPNSPQFADSMILGTNNTVFINAATADVVSSTANHQAISTLIAGHNIIVSGSCASGFNNFGGGFIGRYNDISGNKARNAQTIFAVGTGNSTTRKTGFLIDSGSNTYVEGSLNVSGTFTASGSNFSVDSNGNVTGSNIVTTVQGSNAGFLFRQPSSGSTDYQYNTRLERDKLNIFQYQGQNHIFGFRLTPDNLAEYTGSQFRITRDDGSGGLDDYLQLISASVTSSGGTFNGIEYTNGKAVRNTKALLQNTTAFFYSDVIMAGVGAGTTLKVTGSVYVTGSLTTTSDIIVNNNVTVGLGSGNNNSNIVLGESALQQNTTGTGNVAFGQYALQFGTSSNLINNVAIGANALQDNQTDNNLAIGGNALTNTTFGNTNLAIGGNSMQNNTVGAGNVAIGINSLLSPSNPINTIAIGKAAIRNANGTIQNNVGIGYETLYRLNHNSNYNTAIGSNAFNQLGSGSNNVAIGKDAGYAILTGSGNTILGSNITGSDNWNDVVAIGPNSSVRAFYSASNWDFYANTDISGALDVSGSVTIANSNGNDLYVHGHKQFNAGEFWSTITQSGSAGVSGSITFNTSGSVYGVSIVSSSQVTMANAGVYNIQFSAQIETSAGSDTAYIWFKKNGSNIADSATKVVLANNTSQVMTVNILDTSAANDYYELGYQFTNGNATILAEAASGNIPAIPSVILTVTQAR